MIDNEAIGIVDMYEKQVNVDEQETKRLCLKTISCLLPVFRIHFSESTQIFFNARFDNCF